MASDLPFHQCTQCTQCSQVNIFSSRISEPATLSPNEKSPTFGREEQLRLDVRKRNSFIGRHFGPKRPQATEDDGKIGPLGLRPVFCAPESLIDIVFVHGLRGGSMKTWRLEEDQQFFWPQYWLPKEPELVNASIHTFGYDSDWGSTKPSILNVHDFGQSLYEELRTSPSLRHKPRTSPIILVGHSMGGLVIKKAYILAQQDRAHPELSERIRSIFFLATPHRGSDYAALLNGILKYCGMTGLTSSREYIRDITTGSTSTQLINNDFARYVEDLTIYSFCETLPTIKGSSGLIVDKTSATLGLNPRNEHVQYLHANHRDICKFRSKNDSNYIIIKNALAVAVEDSIRNVIPIINDKVSKDPMGEIQDLLRVTYISEEHHDKLEGSCQWIEDRDDFRTWIGMESRDVSSRLYRPSIFWVQANPGAGKTVLAAHVISQLEHSRLAYASYFFHLGEKSAQSLAGLLKSLAFQMANTNATIRTKLAQIHAIGASFDQDDARAIWTRIFMGGLFQVSMSTPQYWVIDAIDECIDYFELFTFLKAQKSRFPIRIFMTSRKLPDMSRLTRLLEGCDTAVIQIPINDTMKDIELYIRNRIADLPIDEEEERQELARQILAKADTSFLWVRLVLDELEGVYGYDSIMQVLQEIPAGMFSYYERAVTEMSGKKRELHIAKAILLWVMLTTRPLSVSELSHALQLDINVHLPSAKSAIEGLCGQLVSVDVHTGVVQPIHATAREFVLSEEAGEFRISKVQGHERIALTCLRLLVGPEMQPPRHRHLLAQKRATRSISGFADYAITQFSEHVFSASTESDQLFPVIDRFFRTTVLTWIEKVMDKKEAHGLTRTARNLQAYLARRAIYHSSVNCHVSNIETWTIDLSRVESSFGRAMISSPQSVYFLVPPLCPTQSAVFRQFGQPHDSLVLSGYRPSDWSDCVASIQFEDEIAAAIGCGTSHIAIGTESGKLDMYSSRTFQKEQTIHSEFPVELIRVDPFGCFIATCSRKFVQVWNVDNTLRWKTRIRSRCILLSSSQDMLIGVTHEGRSFQWNIDTGELVQEQLHIYQAPDSDTLSQKSIGKAPLYASLSPGFELLALAYRDSPVCIFEFGSGSLIGWAVDDRNRAPEHLFFNPNPDVGCLLVTYNESHLSLYDSWSGTLVESAEAEEHAILTSVTSSPDGRTFATMDILGHLRIWDFESLTLLYHVLTPSRSFSLLHYTSDGLGLVDVSDHEMKIWAPSALIRKTVEEETGSSDQKLVLAVTEGNFEKFQTSKINTLIAHPSRSMLFAGNYNGDVEVYRTNNNYEPSLLYSHKGVIVQCLAANNHDLIASADLHANVQVWRFDVSQTKYIELKDVVLQAHFSAPVSQLLFDASGKYLIISTNESDHVYSMEHGSHVGSMDSPIRDQSAWKWFIVPEREYNEHFLLIADHTITAYSAKDFPLISREICRVSDESMGKKIDSVTHIPDTLSIVVETPRSQAHALTSIFALPPWSSLVHESATVSTSMFPSELCAQFLGVNQASKRMVLLRPDLWVCSVDLKDLEARQYVQHFFVPEEYGSLHSSVHPIQTVDGDFAFCLYDKVVVVKNGLKFQTLRALE
ncbi:hypothetical protein P153DRAFT_331614 [Dothidotthia symphoricarpi CBS 119687]|uniref:GPI inositol-deacylase n=1 Tax=Dothidotthia symphoricarpi CBS 119687 TaxID=1392245 RepID=A0A6A6AMZ7_9PLEO|nr:uncharacterized protein P153DRAFT_331614 [Dothidotthia symphoricarpi CBS 119687]KAF2133160.1 hypothetical protein P153DRAFT_331614 [Dothidotthia symphoricarpi CBS 119687]